MSATLVHNIITDHQVVTLLDNRSALENHSNNTSLPSAEVKKTHIKNENNVPTDVSVTTTNSKKIPNLGPFILLKTLGIGEFGKVKLGRHAETGQIVAVKLVKKQNVDSSSRLEKIRMEIDILKTLNHPYIVKLLCVNETSINIGMVLEYAQGGELFEYIYKQRYLKEEEARRLFSQLISCVNYMHQKNIVHRDLKLENILLDHHGNIIVTDFGFANQFTTKTGDLMSTACGSPVYAAPELVMTGQLYAGTGVDIWSCGIILFAMLCGYLPFDDDIKNPNGDNIGRLYRYILTHKPKYPDHVSSEARDLIGNLLIPDPNKRCNMDTIIAHPWLAEYKDIMSKSVDELERESQLRKKSLLKGIQPTTDLNIILDDEEQVDQESTSDNASSLGNTQEDEKSSDQQSDKAIIDEAVKETLPQHDLETVSIETNHTQLVLHSTAGRKHATIDAPASLLSPQPPKNVSLKAKFLSGIKRYSASEEKSTNRRSWQHRLRRNSSVKERPLVAPLVEASKSERLLSWIKKSTSNHSKKQLTLDEQVIPEEETTVAVVKPSGSCASSTQKSEADMSELRVHTGNMNHSALTSKDPMQVLLEVNKVLLILGMDVKNVGGYKLACVRRSTDQTVDSYQPSQDPMHHLSTSCHSTTLAQPIYGHPSIDNGQEISFTVEICRFENLSGLFCIDIQCQSGNFSGYQFVGQKILSLLQYGDVIRNTNFILTKTINLV